MQNALHAERHLWRRTKLLYAHHVLWGNKIIDTVAVAAAIDPISVPNSLLRYLLVFKDCMQAFVTTVRDASFSSGTWSPLYRLIELTVLREFYIHNKVTEDTRSLSTISYSNFVTTSNFCSCRFFLKVIGLGARQTIVYSLFDTVIK